MVGVGGSVHDLIGWDESHTTSTTSNQHDIMLKTATKNLLIRTFCTSKPDFSLSNACGIIAG